MMLLLGWLNFTRNQRLQLRGLLTYAVSWILLGNILAAAFSSVGPCFYAEFYHDGYFAPLMDELRDGAQEHPIVALTVMRYLLDSLAIDRFGTGISAMPSMHVSIAFLASLVMWQGTRLLWARLLAACFTAATFIASVHLGWHYAVDGLLGVAVIALIWIGVGRFIDRLDGSASGARGTHPPA